MLTTRHAITIMYAEGQRYAPYTTYTTYTS